MKKILMFLFLWGSVVLLPAQSFQWAYHAGGSPNGPDDEKVYRCLCDEHNNSYVLLYYSDIMNTPRLNNIPINLPSTGLTYNYSFLVLASYDCEGNLRWYRSIRRMTHYTFGDYETNNSMNKSYVPMEMIDNHIILATAGWGNRLYLRDEDGHDTLLVNKDSVNVGVDALIKLDTNGNLKWANSVVCNLYPVTTDDSLYFCLPTSITQDNENNIMVLCKIQPSVIAICPSFPLVNDNLLYMLKYSPEGVLLSVKPFLFDSGMGTTNNWSQPHLSYYGGKYYFVGYTSSDSIIINEQPVPVPEGETSSNLYMACIDSTGRCINYKYLSPKGKVSDMDINEQGNIYIAGGVSQEYDSIPLNNPYGLNGTKIFLSKLDTSLNVEYIKVAWSYNVQKATSLALLSDNKIAIGGYMGGSISTFDSIQFSFTGYDCFVAIFDEEQMQFVHAARIISDGDDEGVTALAADNENNLMVCGSYRGDNVLVGDSVFDNYGDLDIFIGRYGWECGEEADWHITGIGENSLPESSLKLCPNPAISLVTLESKTVVMEAVAIFNLMGQQQNSQIVNNHHCTLDISGLAPGLYLLRASFPNGRSETLRFVKQ